MRIVVTGATGLIGNALCESLGKDGHDLVILSRSPVRASSRFPQARVVEWDSTRRVLPVESLEGVDAVINLAGEPIADRRWTPARKRAIRDSRVDGTRQLVEALASCEPAPHVLINASAIGFYGERGDEELDENSPPGSGFLTEVCKQWEEEAQKATERGLRVVLLRTGIVLSPDGGALAKMLPAFKMFAGGPLGGGRQWMSWIHLEDEVGLIRAAVELESIRGPFNATAPQPVTNREFSQTLGRVLGRPAVLTAPGFGLRLIMGEMAQSLLLASQRVLPDKALESGYQFRFPELEGALRDLLG